LQKIDWQTNYWKHSLHLNLKKETFHFFAIFFSPWYFFCFTLAQAHFFLTKLDCYTNKNNHFVLKKTIIKQGDVFVSIQNPRGSHQAWSHFFCWGPNLDVN
jgi:hypothetical protein